MAGSKPAQTKLKATSRRLENFSDGVFAIVVTIMVFEIRVPDSLAFGSDPAALRQLGALLLSYALSFFVIVNLWTSHHYLVFTVKHPTRVTIWLNNLLLFFVTLIPVTTRFLGLHPQSSRAAAAYGLLGVAATIAFMLLRSHAARITDNEIHRRIHHRVLHLTWLFLAIYIVSIPLAFIGPMLTWACFLIVPPMVFLLPGTRAEHAGAEHHELERSCP